MDSTFTEVAKQVPSLAVLAFVVWTFLRHIESSRNSFLETIKAIQAENIDQRSLTRDVIKDNTTATHQVNESLIKLTALVSSFERRAETLMR